MCDCQDERASTASGSSSLAAVHQQFVDDFTRHLNEDDCRVLVDLLKLAVADRAGHDAVQALSSVLAGVSFFLDTLPLLHKTYEISNGACRSQSDYGLHESCQTIVF